MFEDLLCIIHYIVPRVVKRKFKDEDGNLIENKYGYFKNAIESNIRKLNTNIEDLWSKVGIVTTGGAMKIRKWCTNTYKNAMGIRMFMVGQNMTNGKKNNKFSASDAFINKGANSMGNTVKKSNAQSKL